MEKTRYELNKELAQMLKGGVLWTLPPLNKHALQKQPAHAQ